MNDDVYVTKESLSHQVRELRGKQSCLVAVIASLMAQRAIPSAPVMITLQELKSAPDVEIAIDNEKLTISLKGETSAA